MWEWPLGFVEVVPGDLAYMEVHVAIGGEHVVAYGHFVAEGPQRPTRPVSSGVEAWGQVYVEAMAAGVPMVCTRSGIGNDLLEDGANCVLVEYQDANSTYCGLARLAANEHLQSSLISNALRDASHYMRAPDLNTLDFLYGSSPGQ